MMKNVEITPLAHADLENIKIYLQQEFGISDAERILGAIYDELENLSVFPEIGVDMLARYGIVSDYLCLVTHKNYVFYRVESDAVRIIRVLDERRDFLQILFGITTTAEEAEEYYEE